VRGTECHYRSTNTRFPSSSALSGRQAAWLSLQPVTSGQPPATGMQREFRLALRWCTRLLSALLVQWLLQAGQPNQRRARQGGNGRE